MGGVRPPRGDPGGTRTRAPLIKSCRIRRPRRRRFLDAVRRHYPRVLEALAGEPYGLYRQLAARPDGAWLAHVATTPAAIGAAGPEFDRLRERLDAWSVQYRLDAAWCRE